MRLAVYADLVYRQDDNGVSSSTAFVSWLSGLSTHVDELVVFGRTRPAPGRDDHALVGANVRFVPLPYYESLRCFLGVAAATRRSAVKWSEELDQCDAVLLFGPHPYAAVFGWLARFARVPVVVGVRQDFPEYLAHRSNGLRRLAAIAAGHGLELVHKRLARGGGVVAIGSKMAERYANERTRVLSTGVSLVRAADLVPLPEALSRPWPGTHQALVAGRLDPEKNPMLLVDVAKALKRIGPWRLVIAGTGSLAAELAARVRSESLDKEVVLTGRLNRERLFELYRESTVLFHVSLTEGQPQIFYEAAAAGLPIVATEVGGVAAALAEGKRGVLVPPRDPVAFAEAVTSLGTDSTRFAIVEAAWQWAKTETLEAQTARVASFFEERILAAAQLPSRSRGLRRRERSPNHC